MGEQSTTNKICRAFCEKYKESHTDASFEVVDCSEIPPFTAARVQGKFALYGGADAADGIAEWAFSKDLIAKFLACDVLVIGAPMWNFGIPASLKLFFDHVVQPNKTFDPATFAGLVKGKPCFIARASGGVEVGGPMDTGLVYLNHVLGFMGFSHVDVVGVGGAATVEKGVADATALGSAFAFDEARTVAPAPAWEPEAPAPRDAGSVISEGSKVLYVSSSPMGEMSASSAVCDVLVAAMTAAGAAVDRLDLAALSATGDLAPYTAKRVAAKFASFGGKDVADKLDADAAAEWAVTTGLIAQLEAADILVLGVPLWNFGLPYHLKAWLDHVIQPHHTFNPETYGGLLSGKKAFVVLAAGGPTLNTPMDRATPYAKQALGFIGVSDVTFVHVNGTAGPGAADAKATAVKAALASAGLE